MPPISERISGSASSRLTRVRRSRLSRLSRSWWMRLFSSWYVAFRVSAPADRGSITVANELMGQCPFSILDSWLPASGEESLQDTYRSWSLVAFHPRELTSQCRQRRGQLVVIVEG